MNRRPLIALTAAAPLALAACAPPVLAGVGSTTTEDRHIDAVTAVSLDGVGDLRITPGTEPSLTVTAGHRVLDRISTDVRDGVLVLDVDGPLWGSTGEIRYELVLPAVESITVSGAGDIAADLSTSPTLAVHLDGAGEITGHGLDVTALEVEVDGAGDVTLTGDAEQQTVSIDGVGEYDGTGLVSERADVTIGGAGEADVEVTDTLTARVDGAGEIIYSGGAEVRSEVSGVGDIRER